jgi:hypothetical protein
MYVGRVCADGRQCLVQDTGLLVIDRSVAVAVEDQVRRRDGVDPVARAGRPRELRVVIDPVESKQRRGPRWREDLALERCARRTGPGRCSESRRRPPAPRWRRRRGRRRLPRAAHRPRSGPSARRGARPRSRRRSRCGQDPARTRPHRTQPAHRGLDVVHRRRVRHRRDKAEVRARDGEPVRRDRHKTLCSPVGLVPDRPGAAMEIQQCRKPGRRPDGVYRSSRSDMPPTFAYSRSRWIITWTIPMLIVVFIPPPPVVTRAP